MSLVVFEVMFWRRQTGGDRQMRKGLEIKHATVSPANCVGRLYLQQHPNRIEFLLVDSTFEGIPSVLYLVNALDTLVILITKLVPEGLA